MIRRSPRPSARPTARQPSTPTLPATVAKEANIGKVNHRSRELRDGSASLLAATPDRVGPVSFWGEQQCAEGPRRHRPSRHRPERHLPGLGTGGQPGFPGLERRPERHRHRAAREGREREQGQEVPGAESSLHTVTKEPVRGEDRGAVFSLHASPVPPASKRSRSAGRSNGLSPSLRVRLAGRIPVLRAEVEVEPQPHQVVPMERFLDSRLPHPAREGLKQRACDLLHGEKQFSCYPHESGHSNKNIPAPASAHEPRDSESQNSI